MSKPVGGRGCVAPYDTCVIRIPVDIKPIVELLSRKYREEIFNGSTSLHTIKQLSLFGVNDNG